MVKLEVKDSSFSFNVVNVYGLYLDRIPFWENLANVGIFNHPNMVLGGDMIFTTSLREVWGGVSMIMSTWRLFYVFP